MCKIDITPIQYECGCDESDLKEITFCINSDGWKVCQNSVEHTDVFSSIIIKTSCDSCIVNSNGKKRSVDDEQRCTKRSRQ